MIDLPPPINWRKRARAAEIQRDKLLRRCSALDRSVSSHREAYLTMHSAFGNQANAAFRMLTSVSDASRALERWTAGMNSKDTRQVIDDAQAFLRLITHPWEPPA